MTKTPDPASVPTASTSHPDNPAAARAFAIEAARLLNDSHCEGVLIFDVRGLSQLTDFLLIASGTSDRQIKAVGDHVEELARDFDMERLGTDRDESATWVVLDFINVMVHLFEPIKRAHYDLEMLWGDAPQIEWKR